MHYLHNKRANYKTTYLRQLITDILTTEPPTGPLPTRQPPTPKPVIGLYDPPTTDHRPAHHWLNKTHEMF